MSIRLTLFETAHEFSRVTGSVRAGSTAIFWNNMQIMTEFKVSEILQESQLEKLDYDVIRSKTLPKNKGLRCIMSNFSSFFLILTVTLPGKKA